MKEYTEEEIYNVDALFKARLRKQAADQKRAFYIMLMVALALLGVGFLLCLIFVK